MEEHVKIGAIVECQCCFNEAPTNRMIRCEGDSIHYFCYRCIKRDAESQIGLMRYEMKCMDMSNCTAGYSRESLVTAIGLSMMAKLDSLQQQDDIMKANIDGLENCPFCEFKAIYPPPEEDREFRCLNPDCETVSCRLCKEETHIPKSCREAAVVPERHLVEEAMTAALVRTCPKCNVKIVKEFGCDTVTCTKCQCAMCYACRRDIHTCRQDLSRGHNMNQHHGVSRPHEEIKDAQRTTIQEIRAKNPQLSEEELHVQLPADDSHYYRQQWPAPWRPEFGPGPQPVNNLGGLGRPGW